MAFLVPAGNRYLKAWVTLLLPSTPLHALQLRQDSPEITRQLVRNQQPRRELEKQMIVLRMSPAMAAGVTFDRLLEISDIGELIARVGAAHRKSKMAARATELIH